MADKNFILKEGSHIVIIGGGPAGSFFAHFASLFARERGINIKISIFEGKDFNQKGPRGCNLCAGVISEKLYGELKGQNILLPDKCIESVIDGYYFQTQDGGIEIGNPKPSPDKKIVTVFRGNGPMYSQQSECISFDRFLLSHVESMGVTVRYQLVKDIVLPSNPTDRIKIVYGKEEVREELLADLVVGAFGLNTGILDKIRKLEFGYIPPRTVRVCQAEIFLGEEDVQKNFKNRIHLFSIGMKSVKYATITPRGDYVTVSLIGNTDLNKAHLLEFMGHPVVRHMFPEGFKMPKKHCICFPRIQTRSAKHPFTHRFVITGSAGISRYFKNGIESAFVASEIAARSIFESGVSKEAFLKGYHKPVKKLFGSDSYYGSKIFALNDFLTSRRHISSSYLALLRTGKDSTIVKRQLDVLWNLFTGSTPYKVTFFKAIHSILQIKLLPIILTAFVRLSIEYTIGGRELRHEKRLEDMANKGFGPLEDGQTVVIIGGGPAGTACAITLSRLARKRNKELNIVLYEGKDYGEKKQLNPCVGVLSPPIREILERDMGIPFPQNLVLEEIPAYYLHSDDDEIKLEGNGEVSQAVRRILFDSYLLQKANDAGVQVIRSRITNIDIDPGGIMVYSETDNKRADVVVGAFGLDLGSCKVFETTTRYRMPRLVSSILTKFYPGKKEMKRFGNCIHAFLPSLKGIEFGAVTPKIDHLTINIAGPDVNWHWMDNFLLLPQVNKILPSNFAMQRHELIYRKWQFPTAPAKHLYGDRYVTVGDAAGIIRAFKGKGINIACLTGIRAAEIMMDVGISKVAFKDYVKGFSDITGDLSYGKSVKFFATITAHLGLVSSIIKLAKEDKVLRMALFHSVAGSKMFKRIIFDTITIRLVLKIVRIFIFWFFKRFSFILPAGKPIKKFFSRK
ncbi:MAG: hypothetical protein MRK01_08405 [Candidatus Scalindua sp.]|nr:hypothetical protein [Candidatus Scalindua sp.]